MGDSNDLGVDLMCSLLRRETPSLRISCCEGKKMKRPLIVNMAPSMDDIYNVAPFDDVTVGQRATFCRQQRVVFC